MFLLHKFPKWKIEDDPFKRMLAILTDSERFSVLFTDWSVVAVRDKLDMKQYIRDLVKRVRQTRNVVCHTDSELDHANNWLVAHYTFCELQHVLFVELLYMYSSQRKKIDLVGGL